MADQSAGHQVRQLQRSVVGKAIGLWSESFRSIGVARLFDKWAERTLSTRFVIASTLIVCTTMFVIGAWVDNRIRTTVVANASESASLYVQILLQRSLQELVESDRLSPRARDTIANLIHDESLGHRIVEIKIWRPDGTIVYTSDGLKIGDRPPMTPELAGALRGEVRAELDDQHDVESAWERRYGYPILELYTPITSPSGNVIAVIEIYEDASDLMQQLTIARQQSWLLVAVLAMGMLAVLFGIVHRGTLLIQQHKNELESTMVRQAGLRAQNEELQGRVTRALFGITEVSDKLLNRIGADLHDGPAQLLGLALLRLHELEPAAGERRDDGGGRCSSVDVLPLLRQVLEHALSEIRNISAGVSLPELEELSPANVVMLAVKNHKRLTGKDVEIDLGALPDVMPLITKVCLFRCIQEALTNAFRHADGRGQVVRAWMEGKIVRLEISDSGPGLPADGLRRDALGLMGLRNRVESLHGEFVLRSTPGSGTTVSVRVPYGRTT